MLLTRQLDLGYNREEPRDRRGRWISGAELHDALGTPELSDRERQALWYYTGDWSASLNAELDAGHEIWQARDIDAAIGRARTLDRPAVVYHGGLLRGLGPGQSVTPKRYISTSASDKYAASGIFGSGLTRITVPPGVPMLSVRNTGVNHGEDEILLPRGTTFRGTGPGEAEVVPPPTELGWRFDPDEPRDRRGRWTRTGAGYTVPDHSRLLQLKKPAGNRWPYYRDPAEHPFFAAHPVSSKNIVAAFDQASPEEIEQGMRWYADAHTLAKAIAHGDATRGAGLLAAYSPQSPWPVNMFNAARAIELGHALGPGEGMITHAMQKHAQLAMDGKSTDENFGKGAPKIRAFARLIEHGGDHPEDTAGEVVLDRHAMSVAMGVRLTKEEADDAPIDKERFYQHVADEYRKAALEISRRGTPVAPHQVQAITWLRQQRKNAAEDLAGGVGHGGKGAGKGRQVMITRAWDNWKRIATAEHYPLQAGTTTLANLISSQLDLSWRDAWMHERRDRRGRWTRGGTADAIADANIGDAILREWRISDGYPQVRRNLNEASAHWEAGERDQALEKIKIASLWYDNEGNTGAAGRLRALADRIASVPGKISGGDARPADPEAARQVKARIAEEIHRADSEDQMTIYSFLQMARRVMDTAEEGTNWPVVAANFVMKAADQAKQMRNEDRYRSLKDLAHDVLMLPSGTVAADTPQARATQFMRDAEVQIPRLLGGGHLAWDRKPVTLYPSEDDPYILASIDWNGHVAMQREYAAGLADTLNSPDKQIANPDWFSVPLHELIHADIPENVRSRPAEGDDVAYQSREYADIEEGFTELASIQHAPEFFDAMGIGKRETMTTAPGAPDNPAFGRAVKGFTAELQKTWAKLSGDPRAPQQQAAQHLGRRIEDLKYQTASIHDYELLKTLTEIQHLGDQDLSQWAIRMLSQADSIKAIPMTRHATMREYAQAIQDPQRIKSGNAWGHYTDQAMWAEQWVEMIAKGEGYRSRNPKPGTRQWARQVELADEINREGTARKPDVMARQLYNILMKDAPTRDDPKVRDAIMRVARGTILRAWAYGVNPVADIMKEARVQVASTIQEAA